MELYKLKEKLNNAIKLANGDEHLLKGLEALILVKYEDTTITFDEAMALLPIIHKEQLRAKYERRRQEIRNAQ